MADPSAQVAPPLLAHLHCLSKMPYPPVASLLVEMVGDLLLRAPTTVQQHPFHWTMLDTPGDGSLFLVWVPPMLNGGCASDGFVWADADQGYSMELPKGYTIEMIQTKSGFIPSQETHTLHTRRRYRLVAGPKNNPTAAPFDPNLWLFHYMRADRANHIPVASIPLGGVNIIQIQNTRKQIHSLQQQGLISQREFMLHDRNSWPSVTFGLNPQMPQKPQANARGAMGTSNRGYPTTPQAPPNKRQKLPHQGTPQPGPSNIGQHPAPASIAAGHHDLPITIDEEEDTSRGDMLDHLTPREISQARYTQHHEWMEEVLGSVYPVSKIRPVELGLGLRGELEEMTKGLFEPPTFPPTKSIRKPIASRASGEAGGIDNTEEGEGADGEGEVHMDPATLEEFTKRAEAKMKDLEEEMELMKLAHQQRLAKIKKTGAIKEAEELLRANINFNMFGVVDPSVVVEEVGPVPGGEERQVTPPAAAITKTDEEIVAMVEQALKKKIVPKDMVIRWDLETGKVIVGNADLMQEDRDEVMGNTGREGGASASTTLFNEPAKQPRLPNLNNMSPTSNGNTNDLHPQLNDVDVNMDNDDILMDEPSNFADAFDARDLEDPEESNTIATPHLLLPPHHQQPLGGSPIGIPSLSAQTLIPGTTLAANIPSPTAATVSPLLADLKNSPGIIPTVPVPDANSLSTVPSGGVAYTGIPGLGGDQGGV
ncbi:hypothetical protein EV426DRAFT_71811 [Tirmania nivea]|nr:hypothetical protein EV426DRAFT_71811 [Tirmania nivea]